MQAVVLAAGRSSRFFPFATDSHKSLIEVLGKPLIEHTINSIEKTGIQDIVVVEGKDAKIREILGDGKKWGIKISYAVQEEPRGGGNAVLCAKDLIKDDFFLVSPHRVDFESYKDEMVKRRDQGASCVLLLKKGGNLSKYGFVEIEGKEVKGILEKPKGTKDHSGLRVIGIYLLNKDFLRVLEETTEEEYQLEAAISVFSKKNKVGFVETDAETPTLKYSYDLLGIKNYLLSKAIPIVSKTAKIDKTAKIEGDVVIEDGAVISENVSIKGPCYIGRRVYIGTGTLIRDHSSLEEGSKIGAFSEVKNSIMGNRSSVHSGYIGDSVVGSECKIGVYSCTSNVRLDRGEISVELPSGEYVSTGLKNLGAIIGNKVTLGVRVSLMPGVLIGEGSIIGPFSIVMKTVSENSLYYSKFDQIIEKKAKV